MKIVPSSQWTMEKKGTKRVEIAAVDDKQQFSHAVCQESSCRCS